jgi:hypothetical protein
MPVHRNVMYASDMTVGAARDVYFRDNGFSLAAYTERWAKVKLGRLPVVFPNIKNRREAIQLHDLHHVATGYSTSFLGESQIGAWEIAAGCGRYWAAWLLNGSAFGVGLAIAPRLTYRAFMRGRHSKSLYGRSFGDDLLGLTVGELRAKLQLHDDPITPTLGDRIVFAVAATVAYLPFLVPAVLIALLVF